MLWFLVSTNAVLPLIKGGELLSVQYVLSPCLSHPVPICAMATSEVLAEYLEDTS